MKKNQAERELIPISEAAIILGISKTLFRRNFQRRMYQAISIEKYRKGWMADLMDVFHYAYPGMAEDTIAMLIYKYRGDRLERRRKK